MTGFATLSRRSPRRFWGWGGLDQGLSDAERQAVRGGLGRLGSLGAPLPEPKVEEYDLAAPRGTVPAALQEIVSSTPYDRLVHAYGKSYPDLARMWLRQVPHAPDWVAFPRNEEDIVAILDWASGANIAVVPFGGGSSVVGGVESAVGGDYAAVLSLDMERFDQIHEVDRVSRAARIAGGILGPDLEAKLRPQGLTLRHFPQSFEFSTLGGWIVTRAGGHYATQYTHIDDFVESVRMVTPAGTFETRRLPGSGAGPSPDRLVIGSEGTFGVLTSAWMRLQDRPRYRASASVRFETLAAAANCVRALSQSGLQPTNCRLLDANEVVSARVDTGGGPLLVLGFESADHPVSAWMERALELVADHGGSWSAEEVARSMAAETGGSERGDAAGQWRNAFLRMPYWRDEAMRYGVIVDTFESAITWDAFHSFYNGVIQDVGDAIRRITGQESRISCRLTHVYPDGPAPYFSFSARGREDGDLASALAMWREIKRAANEAVIRHGGTSSHHHAVGRDHRSAYEQEVPDLMRRALVAAKAALDPAGIMNPGVLFDPAGRTIGLTGALKGF